jgi:predicted ArsR family transcriptional regulator
VLSRRGVGGQASGARSARRGKRWRFLADELRQRLYRFVAAQSGPVTREQAAVAVGISRKLAASHLDKLAAAGLLEIATADPASRRPGPGRAPKACRPAARRGRRQHS